MFWLVKTLYLQQCAWSTVTQGLISTAKLVGLSYKESIKQFLAARVKLQEIYSPSMQS